MSVTPDFDKLIAPYAAGPFTDDSTLIDVGLVSLSVFRIIAELKPDPGVEIDIEGLAGVRTIAELKLWLDALAGAPASVRRVA
jgi:aryl carrier-like protein